MTIEYHKIMSECWKNGIKIYSNPKNQIIVEKDGEVKKIFNLSIGANPSRKIWDAYKYYHSMGFVV